jgi:hypothetical protein
MKKIIFVIVFFTLLIIPGFKAAAQNVHNSPSTVTFDTSGLPQWAKDLRRWEIVAFGTFPFSMFFANFFYDLYRWNKANGMDFSPEGRQYAPWPFASAGAVEKTNKEFRNSVLWAAGLSASIAFIDFFIVRARRNREQNAESIPSGSFTIERTPNETETTEIINIDEDFPVIEDEKLDVFDLTLSEPDESFQE